MSTWKSHCGIAEYTANLVAEYENLGHEVHVLGNPYYFEVHWWGEGSHLYPERVWTTLEAVKPDVFHVQYQGSLYNPIDFNLMIDQVDRYKLADKLVITVHDSSRGRHNLDYFTDWVYHKKGILTEEEISSHTAHLLPFPIQHRYAKVFSFGMGRNDYELISQVCRDLDIEYTFHDGRISGWLEEDFLFERMKESDAIVLWYNEVPGIIGASAAARTALASHRPVFTNNVEWFQDLDEDIYHISADVAELKEQLRKTLRLDYINRNSFKRVAWYHVSTVYGRK